MSTSTSSIDPQNKNSDDLIKEQLGYFLNDIKLGIGFNKFNTKYWFEMVYIILCSAAKSYETIESVAVAIELLSTTQHYDKSRLMTLLYKIDVKTELIHSLICNIMNNTCSEQILIDLINMKDSTDNSLINACSICEKNQVCKHFKYVDTFKVELLLQLLNTFPKLLTENLIRTILAKTSEIYTTHISFGDWIAPFYSNLGNIALQDRIIEYLVKNKETLIIDNSEYNIFFSPTDTILETAFANKDLFWLKLCLKNGVERGSLNMTNFNTNMKNYNITYLDLKFDTFYIHKIFPFYYSPHEFTPNKEAESLEIQIRYLLEHYTLYKHKYNDLSWTKIIITVCNNYHREFKDNRLMIELLIHKLITFDQYTGFRIKYNLT